jgi:hypothetical protein
MPHIRLLFPSDYIAAGDLRGKEVTLTIAKVVGEEVVAQEGKKTTSKRKAIVYFADSKDPNKRLVLNKTNRDTIVSAYGTETNNWTGKPITLYETTCNAFGNPNTECIRIKIPTRKEKA